MHRLFTQLSLRGSPVDYIVEQTSDLLDSPVLLENLDRKVIVSHRVSDEVLDSWAARSLQRHYGASRAAGLSSRVSDLNGEWILTPVESRGRRWGWLIVLSGPQHPAGRVTVAEQAAMSLALDRQQFGDAGDPWLSTGQQLVLDSVLSGRFRSIDNAAARLEASGLPVRGRRLVAVTLGSAGGAHLEPVGGAGAPLEEALGKDLRHRPGFRRRRQPGCPGQSDRLAAGGQLANGSWTSRLARAVGTLAPETPFKLVVSQEERSLAGVLTALGEAAADLQGRPVASVGRILLFRPAERPFVDLLTRLRSDDRVQSFVEDSIGLLIRHDLEKGSDYLSVLWAYVNNPGNRSRAAQASFLSRSMFYQRLGRIEDLLHVDLTDGTTVAGLHAALLIHRTQRRA